MDPRPTITTDAKCAACGGEDFVLARDKIEFTSFTAASGALLSVFTHTEEMDSDDPMGNVRFFCSICGEYHQVPENLL